MLIVIQDDGEVRQTGRISRYSGLTIKHLLGHRELGGAVVDFVFLGL
jgi:hypothetical protein